MAGDRFSCVFNRSAKETFGILKMKEKQEDDDQMEI